MSLQGFQKNISIMISTITYTFCGMPLNFECFVTKSTLVNGDEFLSYFHLNLYICHQYNFPLLF